ncbi:MAG: hypothetical protein IH899_09540 [Planctomycetes bacterium]|nr:hypothetical protein [Planctomycetota bacterium]
MILCDRKGKFAQSTQILMKSRVVETLDKVLKPTCFDENINSGWLGSNEVSPQTLRILGVRCAQPQPSQSQKSVSNQVKPVQIILAALLILLLIRAESTAEDFAEGFDTTTPSCRIHYDTSRLKLISHQRHTTRHSGRSSERVIVEAFQPGRIQLELTLPGARVIDDLKLSLWVHSNQPGAVLFLRLVFPHQTDPRTEKRRH